MTPMHKNVGKHNSPTNYRSISVISVIAEVFERIIYDYVHTYLIDTEPHSK